MLETARKVGSALRNRGLCAVTWEGLHQSGIYDVFWNTATSRWPVGTNVFDKDWDLLVILDTCRPDELRDLAPNREWLHEVDTLRSVGSSSPEWYLNTFSKEYLEDLEQTAVISGNIYAHRILNDWAADSGAADDFLKRGFPNWTQISSDELLHFEQIQGSIENYDTLHSESSATAHIITDRTISVGRTLDWNRLIVHYTLPHVPFIANAMDWAPQGLSIKELMDGPEELRGLSEEEEGYQPYAYGDFTRSDAYEIHRNNLNLVLDYVDILLNNIDAEKAVISADHGEALGEYGLWDHDHGFPFGPMRVVPWAEVNANDTGEYTPQYDSPGRLPDEDDRKEFLKQMGYL